MDVNVWICKHDVMNVCIWYSLLWGYCIVKSHEYCTILRDKFWYDKPWIPLWESWVLWWQIHIKNKKKTKFPLVLALKKPGHYSCIRAPGLVPEDWW